MELCLTIQSRVYGGFYQFHLSITPSLAWKRCSFNFLELKRELTVDELERHLPKKKNKIEFKFSSFLSVIYYFYLSLVFTRIKIYGKKVIYVSF